MNDLVYVMYNLKLKIDKKKKENCTLENSLDTHRRKQNFELRNTFYFNFKTLPLNFNFEVAFKL